MKKGMLIIESENKEGVIEKKEYELDKKDINAIKTVIVDRERKVARSNQMNAREAQEKDKILKRLSKLLWWEW